MRIFDFLFYHIALYYEKNPRTLTWSSPAQRAGYALGLTAISWLMALQFFIEIDILKTTQYGISIIHLILAVGLIYLFRYIYEKKGRYELTKSSKYRPFDINDSSGITVSWIIVFFSFMLPYFILIINMKSV